VGVVGAFAALAFDNLVGWVQEALLSGIGGYTPPDPGSLEPAALIPVGLERLWLPLVTTLGGLLSGFIVYRWAPEAEGHGTDAAIAAYHQHGGEIRPRIPLIKAITSALTIGSGGVAGREGPTAQISVGLGGLLSHWLDLRGQERRSLLLASMAAGLAAMFRAPLGMAIFAVEILYSGMIFESEALIYTVIAAVTSYAVFGLFTGWSSVFAIPMVSPSKTLEPCWALPSSASWRESSAPFSPHSSTGHATSSGEYRVLPTSGRRSAAWPSAFWPCPCPRSWAPATAGSSSPWPTVFPFELCSFSSFSRVRRWP
jgi:CIC family chloride channel protein